MPSKHQWIFDVLSDLHGYALANGLPALARKAEEALETARTEIAAQGDVETAEPGGTRRPEGGGTETGEAPRASRDRSRNAGKH